MEDLFFQITGNIANIVQSKYTSFVELAPFILGSIAIFLFGWILAELASKAILKMSEKLKLEWMSEKIGLKHFLSRTKTKLSPSHVIAKSIKGYLIFLFFIEATKVAKLTQVADFLGSVMGYVPDVLIAIFIMLVGIKIGNTMQLVISTSLSFAKSNTADVLGLAAKGTIIAFAILAALSELEIADILVQTLFIGFVSMLALAGGLAFGLGGKDVVKELLEAIKRVEVKQHKNHKVVR